MVVFGEVHNHQTSKFCLVFAAVKLYMRYC